MSCPKKIPEDSIMKALLHNYKNFFHPISVLILREDAYQIERVIKIKYDFHH